MLLSMILQRKRTEGKTTKVKKPRRSRRQAKKREEGNRIPSLLRLLQQRRFDEIIEILQFQKQNYLTVWLTGSDEDDNETWAESSTAIHALVEHSAPEPLVTLMLEKLGEIKRGYMPEASIDEDGQTPLHIAAQRGSDISVVQRLTAASELPALTLDSLGRFPLHYACMNRSPGAIDIVHHLLDLYPQAVTVHDSTNCTPLDLAVKVRQHPHVLLELSMVHRTMVMQRFGKKKTIPGLIQTNKRACMDGEDVSTLGSVGVITMAKRQPTTLPVETEASVPDLECDIEKVRFAI